MRVTLIACLTILFSTFGYSLFAQKQMTREKVQAWIDNQISKSDTQPLANYDVFGFFRSDTARIVGYMKGYDPKLEFKVGFIRGSNELTKEEIPVLVKFYRSGFFEADIPLSYPMVLSMEIAEKQIPVYLEPGCTLGLILDWEDILSAKRKTNGKHDFKAVEYIGPLGNIGDQLSSIDLQTLHNIEFQVYMETLAPMDFLTKMKDMLSYNQKIITEAYHGGNISAKTLKLLQAEAYNMYGYALSYYEHMTVMFDNQEDYKNKFPDEFYNFLQEIPLNDHTLLASNNFSEFIDWFKILGRCYKPFSKRERYYPQKGFLTYLAEDESQVLTEEETMVRTFQESIPASYKRTDEEIAFNTENLELLENIDEKYSSYWPSYRRKYFKDELYDMLSEEWYFVDSIFTQQLQIQPSAIMLEIAKLRRLNEGFERKSKEEGQRVVDSIGNYIKNPFLRAEALRVFNQIHTTEENSYELPMVTSAELFRKLIEPLEGKYILVDFWDMQCGGCLAGIKDMKEKRRELKGSTDIAFVFITNTTGAPKDSYKKFVAEQEFENTYRLSDDEFNYMRKLLKFNSIPHYVTIDRKGLVMKRSLSPFFFQSEFERLIRTEKKND